VKARDVLSAVLRGLIWLYRHTFSYFLGRQCRFVPTCSVYADEAIRLHGPIKGSALAVRRLCRCHPFGGSGFDPVPKAADSKPFPPAQPLR
jgi:putative membrane protein insertion efficiency factor